MKEVVIVDGARTAVGVFGGSLKDVKCADLGAIVIKEAIKRAGLRPAVTDFVKECRVTLFGEFDKTETNRKYYDYDDSLIPVYFDECIMGNVIQAAQGQNPGRQASIYAGLPEETTAITVNKVCASGMKAITLAAQAIKAGDADIIVAGGMESMSNSPYALPKARWGYRMNMPFGEVIDTMVYDGLYEQFHKYHMGFTAENIATDYGITREEQDELSVQSHERALAAIASGEFTDEIVPVVVPQPRGGSKIFEVDERPRETTLEKMAKLPPMFTTDGHGTVTAGNSSGVNEGAAALVLMSSQRAEELDLEPLAKIKGYASGGVDTAYMGLGVIPATRKVLRQLGLTIGDFDFIELNEAFASQAIACMRELDINLDKCNLNGSGISIGHPIGCTGARITYSLARQLKKKDLNLGLATLCVGGGQGMALVLERA